MKKRKRLLSTALAFVCLFSLLPKGYTNNVYTNNTSTEEKFKKVFICGDKVSIPIKTIKTYKSRKYHASLSLKIF